MPSLPDNYMLGLDNANTQFVCKTKLVSTIRNTSKGTPNAALYIFILRAFDSAPLIISFIKGIFKPPIVVLEGLDESEGYYTTLHKP